MDETDNLSLSSIHPSVDQMEGRGTVMPCTQRTPHPAGAASDGSPSTNKEQLILQPCGANEAEAEAGVTRGGYGVVPIR